MNPDATALTVGRISKIFHLDFFHFCAIIVLVFRILNIKSLVSFNFKMEVKTTKKLFGGKTKFYFYSLLLFLFLASLNYWGSSKAQEESFGSCCLFGLVNYRGDKTPDGYTVEAWIGDQKFAETKTISGNYLICIPQDDPTTPEKDGWANGDWIILKVNGNQALPTVQAFSGTKIQDIWVPSLGDTNAD